MSASSRSSALSDHSEAQKQLDRPRDQAKPSLALYTPLDSQSNGITGRTQSIGVKWTVGQGRGIICSKTYARFSHVFGMVREGQHIDRVPSFLYTLQELRIVMLDSDLTNALHHQNWSFEPETASDKAWEEMRFCLTGNQYYHFEQDSIMWLGNRGTNPYRGLAQLYKGFLAHSIQM
ncbi:hypothetical protein E6O75_ATG05517 [Venturia nashicola]|uniref:Uncharacterized protein n=1 Tax=Venturia nashicola TaxID=86259 RepID=A0A4Z1NX79_9PEZI|nr:hypothetical protein E6O75_ATG05517 [Venturia nashicola]